MPVVIDETMCSIKRLRSGVPPFDLQMKCMYAVLAASVFCEAQRLCAQSEMPVALTDVDLVQNRITTAIFDAEAEGDDGVPDGRSVGDNDPRSAELWVLR
jgi:hypothetical protein